MSLPDVVRTTRLLLWDTARQALATRLAWLLIGGVVVATLFCAGTSVEGGPAPLSSDSQLPMVLPKAEANKLTPEELEKSGVRPLGATLSLGFGAARVPISRGRDDAVRQVQLVLAAYAADTAGILLALLWTAGFLPTFLEPQAASVLLAKSSSRTLILLGKYLAVVLFVGLFAALFVASTWAALGLRTGVWPGSYWLAVPLITLNFATFYAVSALFAVWTRSTVASAFGVLAFWLVCLLVNYGRHHLSALPPEQLGAAAGYLSEIGYWLLPKPLDFGAAFYDALDAGQFGMELEDIRAARQAGRLNLPLSLASSAAFAAGVLGLAGYELRQADY